MPELAGSASRVVSVSVSLAPVRASTLVFASRRRRWSRPVCARRGRGPRWRRDSRCREDQRTLDVGCRPGMPRQRGWITGPAAAWLLVQQARCRLQRLQHHGTTSGRSRCACDRPLLKRAGTCGPACPGPAATRSTADRALGQMRPGNETKHRTFRAQRLLSARHRR